MRQTGCTTEYTTSAMHSNMAFSACSTAAADTQAAPSAARFAYDIKRDTACAVSLFALLLAVAVAALIGMLSLISLPALLLVLDVIYIIVVRIIIPPHGKANVKMNCPVVA